jgi:hypothetical protein
MEQGLRWRELWRIAPAKRIAGVRKALFPMRKEWFARACAKAA